MLLCHAPGEDHRVWDAVTLRLAAAGCRVVAFDQRGHGASVSVPVSGVTLADLAADVAGVLERLDLQDVVVAGHSAGGYALLALPPPVVRARVRAVVLVGTAPAVGGRVARAVLRAATSTPMARLQGRPTAGRALVRVGAFGRRPSAIDVERTRVAAAATPPAVKRAFVEAALADPDLRNRTVAGVPVVALFGSSDRLVRPQHQPAWRVEVLPGAGHQLPLERPAAIADAILSCWRTG